MGALWTPVHAKIGGKINNPKLFRHLSRRASWFISILFLVTSSLSLWPVSADSVRPSENPNSRANNSANESPYTVFLPLLGASCPGIPTETFSTLTILGRPTDRPAEKHPDLNLDIRGYIETAGYLGLVDLRGPTDLKAPQLYRLFGDKRTRAFRALFRVYDWDWNTYARSDPISEPPVTFSTLETSPGEPIHIPDSRYNIGTVSHMPQLGVEADDASLTASESYEVLVLYAAPDRITLKYTREDNVVRGYTLHVEGICVEPRLLVLYEQLNRAGRAQLPALRARQSFGTAVGTEIGVAIRDSGTFLDPRSRKDWWRGR